MAELPRHSEEVLKTVVASGEPVEGLCPSKEVMNEVCLAIEAMGPSSLLADVSNIMNSTMEINEVTLPALELGDLACIPEGIEDRPSLDLEVVEALTMLPKTASVAMPPMNIIVHHVDAYFDDFFAQGIYDLLCTFDRVSMRIAHSEVNAIILLIVEDVTTLVDNLDAIDDCENNEAVSSSIIEN